MTPTQSEPISAFAGLPLTSAADLMASGMIVIIYGAPGSGKTPTACNVVKSQWGSPGCLIDAEAGARSVLHLVEAGELEVVRPDTFAKVEAIVKVIRYSKEPLPHKSYIFDNLSEINRMCMKEILISKGKTEPEIQFWNLATSRMLKLVRDLRDAAAEREINIIILAWDTANKDEGTGIVKRDLSFNPALQTEIPGLVDIVGLLRVGLRGQRELSFEANDRTAARFRRSLTDVGRKIPDSIKYGIDDYPIADMVNTLRGGMPFPEKYAVRAAPITAHN